MVEAAGPAAGLSRLAGVCVEDLADTEDCARIALRWEAIAADGKLFAALDAGRSAELAGGTLRRRERRLRGAVMTF